MNPLNHIERIEVQNFKSYKGFHTLGPFHNFTAIIGPNGSGKSNVMDAISFVLGMDIGKLRATSLGDLIHEDGKTPKSSLDCFVRLTFTVISKGGILETHTFKRSVTLKKSTSGQKDAFMAVFEHSKRSRGAKDAPTQTLTKTAYLAALSSLGIEVTVPNCLVFQGEVQSITRMTGKELTALIEYVSGSDQFRAEYERLLRERETVKEDADFLDKKRKGLKEEHREYKDQKKEADAHTQLAETLGKLKLRQYLFQMWYVAADIEALKKELDAKKLELANVEGRLREGEAKLPDIRKRHAEAQKEMDAAERALSFSEKQLYQAKPEVLVKENEVAYLRKKYEMLRRDLEEVKSRQARAEEKREQYAKELKELDAKEAAFQKENEEAVELSGQKLSAAEMKEFATIKESARAQNSTDRAALLALEREQESDVGLFEEVHKPRMTDLNDRVRLLETEELPASERRLAELKADYESIKSEKEKLETERVNIHAENADILQKKQECEERIYELQEQLKRVRVDISETDRQQKMEEALQTMKRLFPGVHGRIVDLVEPSQDRYKLALTVALGAQMDSIVVADKKIAIECIQYMKEQRIGVATFIPLDSIRTDVSYDRLRVLEPGVLKPIIDVLKYDPAYQTAMEYVCGSTLVCADLDKAREWAFQHGKRHKVVTFDGILIAKSGFMTGGIAGVEARAQRWDTKKLGELRTKLEAEGARLTDLNTQMRNVARERELQGICATFEARLAVNKIDREMAQQARDSVKKKIDEAKQSIAKNRAAYEKLQADIDKRTPQINTLKAKIADVEDVLYAPFAKKVGVRNLREWEEMRKSRLKSLAEKGLIFKTQRSRIQNLMEYAQQQDDVAVIERHQKQLDELRAQIKSLESDIAERRAAIEHSTEAIEKAKENFETKKKLAEEKNKILKDAIRDTDARKMLRQALVKAIDAKESSMEQLKSRRHQILARAKADDILLPGQSRGDEGEEGEEASSDLGERMDVDEPELKQTQSMSTQEISERTKKEDEIKIDFRKLEKEYKECRTVAQREEKFSAIVADVQSVAAKLETIAPNYKANDRLDVVVESIEKLDEQIRMTTEKAHELRTRFLQVSEQRKRKFMSAFEHIDEKIDAVYKALTGDFGVANIQGATDEPFNHPVHYSLKPKNKAFCDIQLLSGGEKSIAALAFLFALQSYRPSPFFVLDEVDAALDPDNVEVVAEYFQKRARNMQFIIISLSEKLFDKADALVGICTDVPNQSSKSFTLDLNKICGPQDS